MADDKRLSRRSFLRAVTGAAVAIGAVGAVTGPAQALTDSDSGASSDPVGRGRGTGITDSDGGQSADRAGYGQGRSTYSDQDSGPSADAHGRGFGSGYTDTDSGAGADPYGSGRASGLTDRIAVQAATKQAKGAAPGLRIATAQTNTNAAEVAESLIMTAEPRRTLAVMGAEALAIPTTTKVRAPIHMAMAADRR